MKAIMIIGLYVFSSYGQHLDLKPMQWQVYLDSIQKEKEEEEALQEVFGMMLKDSSHQSVLSFAEALHALKLKKYPHLKSNLNLDSLHYLANQQLNVHQFKQEEKLIKSTQIYKKHHHLDSNYRVYGFHPFWNKKKFENYNFSLLSDLNFFSYQIEPKTGSQHGEELVIPQSLLDSCNRYQVKTHINISCFGPGNLTKFLGNPKAVEKCIAGVMHMVNAFKLNGVCIDFEGLRAQHEKDYLNFIVLLRNQLKTNPRKLELHVCIPAIDYYGLFKLDQFSSLVDLFIVMGYQFHGSFSKNAGPVAPLLSGNKWWEHNLTTSISNYLKYGIENNKMILALPYYGSDWTTESWYIPSEAQKFHGHLTYSQVLDLCKTSKNAIMEDFSGSKCFFYKDAHQNAHQVWFEDSSSLALKYQWLKQQNIGGVGIWALGFDHGRRELWSLIAQEFAIEKQELEQPIKWSRSMLYKLNYGLRALKNPKILLQRPKMLIWGFGALTGFSLLSFYLIFRQAHRLKKWMFKGLQMSLVLCLLILLFGGVFVLIQPNEQRADMGYLYYLLLLFLGFAFGALAMVAFNRFQFFSKDKP